MIVAAVAAEAAAAAAKVGWKPGYWMLLVAAKFLVVAEVELAKERLATELKSWAMTLVVVAAELELEKDVKSSQVVVKTSLSP